MSIRSVRIYYCTCPMRNDMLGTGNTEMNRTSRLPCRKPAVRHGGQRRTRHTLQVLLSGRARSTPRGRQSGREQRRAPPRHRRPAMSHSVPSMCLPSARRRIKMSTAERTALRNCPRTVFPSHPWSAARRGPCQPRSASTGVNLHHPSGTLSPHEAFRSGLESYRLTQCWRLV